MPKQYAAFRARLVDARVSSGLTQEEVDRRLGRTKNYTSKCETGERRVDVIELAQFAKLYRKRLSYFVT